MLLVKLLEIIRINIIESKTQLYLKILDWSFGIDQLKDCKINILFSFLNDKMHDINFFLKDKVPFIY